MREYSIRSELLEVRFSDLGGRIIGIYSDYFPGNLVLRYGVASSDDEAPVLGDEYKNDTNYLGAIVGRYANRIGGAEFTLDGKKYALDKNDNGVNCLHGGLSTYANRTFEVSASYSSAILKLQDPEGVFPGNVELTVRYRVLGSTFIIEYLAKTDKPTVINLTNHMYFDPNGPIEKCLARFNSSSFTPLGENMIPTGTVAPVSGTPFDFTSYKSIGEGLASADEQIAKADGYDHNFVIDGEGLKKAAEVYMPAADMTLTVSTTEPGFQFYTGNFLAEPFTKRAGFCVETQHFPDSPNKKDFPACVYTPEKPFRSKTLYSFTCGKAE